MTLHASADTQLMPHLVRGGCRCRHGRRQAQGGGGAGPRGARPHAKDVPDGAGQGSAAGSGGRCFSRRPAGRHSGQPGRRRRRWRCGWRWQEQVGCTAAPWLQIMLLAWFGWCQSTPCRQRCAVAAPVCCREAVGWACWLRQCMGGAELALANIGGTASLSPSCAYRAGSCRIQCSRRLPPQAAMQASSLRPALLLPLHVAGPVQQLPLRPGLACSSASRLSPRRRVWHRPRARWAPQRRFHLLLRRLHGRLRTD